MSPWAIISTLRLEKRSAITPLNSEVRNIARPNPRNTPPMPAFEPVSSFASHPRAICCACVARNTNVPESHSTR